MDGIDTTEIVRLREFARQCDWYAAFEKALHTKDGRDASRAGFATWMARLARQEADEIERADGLAPKE
jgi:hypothetical protein